MSKCEYCNKEMLDINTTTCNKTHLLRHDNGIAYKRLPYKNEYRPEPHQCHDCGVQLGGIHHFGCDMERCPICKDEESQLISCEHWDGSEEPIIVK
jgi:hypothetical protein